MKNRLNKITIAFLALGFLVLLFPMRTGSLKTFKMSTTLIGNVGPCSKSSFMKSKVDYGRTFILLLLTSAGGLGTFLWSRKISLKDK